MCSCAVISKMTKAEVPGGWFTPGYFHIIGRSCANMALTAGDSFALKEQFMQSESEQGAT